LWREVALNDPLDVSLAPDLICASQRSFVAPARFDLPHAAVAVAETPGKTAPTTSNSAGPRRRHWSPPEQVP